MKIEKAKIMVEDMLDLCRQLGDENLSDACEGIYNDLKATNEIEDVVISAREFMVFVNEARWEDYDMSDVKEEIENIFNLLIEELEDF